MKWLGIIRFKQELRKPSPADTAPAKGAKFYSTACRNANLAGQLWPKITT
jgi:hypothetical protein